MNTQVIFLKKSSLRKYALAVLVLLGVLFPANIVFAQSRITVDAASVKNEVSPLIYGAGMEDVNHEIYGGLYDQRIFGESFEEPFLGAIFKGFKTYGGSWQKNGNTISVKADEGAKIVREMPVVIDGTIEVELKFGNQYENAGLVVRVDNADIGADNFDGYEISLNPITQRIILGKHIQDWRLLQEASVNFQPKEWTKLKAELSGATIRIYINDNETPSLTYTDNSSPLLTGKIGLRTWKSDVSFRNLKIQTAGNTYTEVFDCEYYQGAIFNDFDSYGGEWSGNQEQIFVRANDGAKLIRKDVIVEVGSAEVELRFGDNPNSDNAGLIVHVDNPSMGADNFDGYEINLNPRNRKLVLGKHIQDWQLLREVDINFIATNWNLLRVELTGATIRVLLNGVEVLRYTDTSSPLLKGKVGIRTWRSDVSFRNLKIENASGTTLSNFSTAVGQSGMWNLLQENKNAVFTQDDDNPFNGKYAQKIAYPQGSTGKAGLTNQSLNRWGIAVRADQEFQGRVYLRGTDFDGSVTVALQSADGTKTYASAQITDIKEEWAKHPFTLTTNTTDTNARFAIWMDSPGNLWIDQVVLMSTGEDQYKGLPLRADIANAMVDQGLTFLRYGGTMIEAREYRFKKMIGDRDLRPPYTGHWYTYSTNGFGIEDFLQFCEAAGFVASFAMNIEETAQDAADMVEYLNGDINTVWGQKRAENGHPEPYNVKYIEIGNEEGLHVDNADVYNHYIDRFNVLYDAMIAKDPDLQIICSAWWRPDSRHIKSVFDAINGKAAYWDHHPWAEAANSGTQVEREIEQMQRLFKQWDPNTTLKCAIFEENGNTHNLERALGHATILNTVRRHNDFILTTCAANALQPYKQNDNGWDQGQVFFTPSQVWGMPTFYAQQMASRTHLPLRVAETVVGNLDVTATRSEDGTALVLHVVNTQNVSLSTTIQINGFGNGLVEMETATLTGDLKAVNSPEEPEKIIPEVKTEKVDANEFTYNIKPYSYTTIKLTRDTNSDIQSQRKEKQAIKAIREGDTFVLLYPQDTTSVSVYDMSSQLLAEYALNSEGMHTMSANHLTCGAYLLRFNDKEQTTLKVLK